MNFYYVNNVIILIHRRSHTILNFRVIIDLIIQFSFFIHYSQHLNINIAQFIFCNIFIFNLNKLKQ